MLTAVPAFGQVHSGIPDQPTSSSAIFTAPGFQGTGSGGWQKVVQCGPAPSTPAAGQAVLYADSGNSCALSVMQSSGVVTVLSSTSAGGTVGNEFDFNFDSGGTSVPTCTGTAPTLDTTHFYSSPNGYQFNGTAQVCAGTFATGATEWWARMELYITTRTTTSQQLAQVKSSTAEQGTIYFTTGYVLSYYDDANATNYPCSTNPLTVGTMHRVEFHWKSSATGGALECKVDGVLTGSTTNINTGTTATTLLNFGVINTPASPYTFTLDNVGADTRGWLGAP